jgi:hypothetical protein
MAEQLVTLEEEEGPGVWAKAHECRQTSILCRHDKPPVRRVS